VNIGYIGSSATMIKILKDWKNHNICVWFCDSSKESSELELLSEKMQVSLFYINKEEQIIEQMAKCPKQIDYFIVYKTGIIIHEKMLDKYSFFNFHPGSLETNRGAYPLVWSVLLGEKEATMSLHQINEGIDAGPLICEKKIYISENDTPPCLEKRLEKEIPLMLDKIDFYRSGKCDAKIIENGVYRRKIQKNDYTIDFEKDSYEIMCRKINSQKGYEGAVLWYKGKEFRCISVELMDEFPSAYEGVSDKIVLERDNQWYCFSLII